MSCVLRKLVDALLCHSIQSLLGLGRDATSARNARANHARRDGRARRRRRSDVRAAARRRAARSKTARPSTSATGAGRPGRGRRQPDAAAAAEAVAGRSLRGGLGAPRRDGSEPRRPPTRRRRPPTRPPRASTSGTSSASAPRPASIVSPSPLPSLVDAVGVRCRRSAWWASTGRSSASSAAPRSGSAGPLVRIAWQRPSSSCLAPRQPPSRAPRCANSVSERMSIRQPVRRAASRAFWPSRPIASDELVVGDDRRSPAWPSSSTSTSRTRAGLSALATNRAGSSL